MICKKCDTEKGVDFYNKDRSCKDCRKKSVRLRSKEKSEDPNWVERERARNREKYVRLGYKDKQKEWDKDKVWKNTSAYKNLHRDLKIPKGIAAHHWSYADDKLRDVVLMNNRDHKAFHELIELDIKKRIFKVKATGESLFRRNRHLMFIKLSGFKYQTYSKGMNHEISN